MTTTARLALALGLASLAACYYSAGANTNATSGASSSNGNGATNGSSNGLPCDVDTLLANNCRSCHGVQAGATAMNSYADLVGPSKTQPAKRLVDVAIERMKGTGSQMPPSGLLPAAQTAILEQWVAGGTTQGTCDSSGSSTQSVCTSNRTWSRGNNASMRPGEACISCHKTTGGEAPIYDIMGTVYPTMHEPNDCNGLAGTTSGVKVVVTGANGASLTLSPNASGNFMGGAGNITFPAHAKVVDGNGKERAMSGEVPNGDCNSCHTETGANGAPGRIQGP